MSDPPRKGGFLAVRRGDFVVLNTRAADRAHQRRRGTVLAVDHYKGYMALLALTPFAQISVVFERFILGATVVDPTEQEALALRAFRVGGGVGAGQGKESAGESAGMERRKQSLMKEFRGALLSPSLEEDGTIVLLGGIAFVKPPYRPSSCLSQSPTVLGRVQALVGQFVGKIPVGVQLVGDGPDAISGAPGRPVDKNEQCVTRMDRFAFTAPSVWGSLLNSKAASEFRERACGGHLLTSKEAQIRAVYPPICGFVHGDPGVTYNVSELEVVALEPGASSKDESVVRRHGKALARAWKERRRQGDAGKILGVFYTNLGMGALPHDSSDTPDFVDSLSSPQGIDRQGDMFFHQDSGVVLVIDLLKSSPGNGCYAGMYSIVNKEDD
eukprot:g477.t1